MSFVKGGRHLVFVYGTLKRGEPNHHWLRWDDFDKILILVLRKKGWTNSIRKLQGSNFTCILPCIWQQSCIFHLQLWMILKNTHKHYRRFLQFLWEWLARVPVWSRLQTALPTCDRLKAKTNTEDWFFVRRTKEYCFRYNIPYMLDKPGCGNQVGVF